MSDGGLKSFQNRLRAIPDEARKAVAPALMKSAYEIQDQMEQLAPEDTGDLVNSIAVTGPGEQTPPYSQPGGSAVEPYVLYPVAEGGMWSSAGPGPELMKSFGLSPATDGDTSTQQLVRMVCATRADSGRDTDEEVRFNAGGFIQLAHLTRDFVQSSIVHRWPEDVIGQPIDPNKGEALPAKVMEALGATA